MLADELAINYPKIIGKVLSEYTCLFFLNRHYVLLMGAHNIVTTSDFIEFQ